MSSRMRSCQYRPATTAIGSSTAVATARTAQECGRGGRGSRSTTARQAAAANTPRPYPTAAFTPHTSPCTSPLRGSSDGVNDRHVKTSANHSPGSE